MVYDFIENDFFGFFNEDDSDSGFFGVIKFGDNLQVFCFFQCGFVLSENLCVLNYSLEFGYSYVLYFVVMFFEVRMNNIF